MRRMLSALVLLSLVTIVTVPARAHAFAAAEFTATQRLFTLLQQPFAWIWSTVLKTGSEFDPFGREAPSPRAEIEAPVPEMLTESGSEFDPYGAP